MLMPGVLNKHTGCNVVHPGRAMWPRLGFTTHEKKMSMPLVEAIEAHSCHIDHLPLRGKSAAGPFCWPTYGKL